MTQRTRSALVTGLVLALVLALETYGLRQGTTGLVILGAVAAMALGAVAFRVELKWAGVAAALACAFTLTWNGWFLGPVRPGDVLILLTLLLLLLADPNAGLATPPWWVKQLALAILLVAAITIFFPPDPLYMSQRIVLGATGVPTTSYKGSLNGAVLGIAFKFVVAVFATPVAFLGAVKVDRRAARWLGVAFATGAALSGLAATAAKFGVNIGGLITNLPLGKSRQVGFANQPNFLAAGLVLAIPFAFWLLASTRRRDWIIGLASMPFLLGGVYASGSRGGAVCAVLAIGLCVVLHPRTRASAPAIAVAGVVATGVIAGLVPSVGHAILKATRLAGGPTTSGSDSVRQIVGDQGIRDFLHAPLHGIGLEVSFDASQVYKQELASGGLILFVAMQVYMLAAIVTALRYIPRNDMAVALAGSLIITLGLNYFEADLTDRFYYVPAAILIAMVYVHERERTDEETEPEESRYVLRRRE